MKEPDPALKCNWLKLLVATDVDELNRASYKLSVENNITHKFNMKSTLKE
jgi:hypothetical protein